MYTDTDIDRGTDIDIDIERHSCRYGYEDIAVHGHECM